MIPSFCLLRMVLDGHSVGVMVTMSIEFDGYANDTIN